MARHAQLLLAAVVAAVVASGCEANQPALVIDSVRPNLVASDRESVLLIEGSFYAPVGVDLSSGSQHLRDAFEAALGGTPLEAIELLSETELTAVVPTAFPVGEHDLLVRDALDREADLERAVRVLPGDGSCPRVVILAPTEGERFFPGGQITVLYYVVDNPPGRITGVEWIVTGTIDVHGERTFTTPMYEYYGSFDIELPPEPGDRELVIMIFARDDAPNPNECSARLEVVVDRCQSAIDCDDGRFCNGPELCVDGVCGRGDPPICVDDVACTSDECDEDLDQCAHRPNDAACDDERFCNGVELCVPDLGCVDGEPPCDDGIECTIDICDEGSPGECRSVAVDDLCDDGVFCNGDETCSADVGCVAGSDPCEDSQECTTSMCHEDQRLCDVELHDELCNDGDVCTVDRCVKDEGCVWTPATEGPRGHISCDDAIDNDCDGLFDAEDDDCDE